MRQPDDLPTVKMLEDHIGQFFTNLAHTQEFFEENYSKLERDNKSINRFRNIFEGAEKLEIAGKEVDIKEFFATMDDFDKTLPKMKHLNQMVIIYAIAILEAYIKEITHFFYRNFPKTMTSSQKKLTYDEILDMEDIHEIHYLMATVETDKFGYFNIEKIAKEIDHKFKINLAELPNWHTIREVFYRRNAIVHNNGEIDGNYRNKITNDDSQILPIDNAYVKSMFEAIRGMMDYLKAEFIQKFKVSTLDFPPGEN